MRNNRLIYSVFFLFFLVYAMISNHFFAIIFFYLLLVIPLVSFLHLLYTFYNFRFNHEVNERVIVKGDEIHYAARIYNNNKFFVYCPISIHLAYEQLFTKKRYEYDYFTLFPEQVKEFNLPIECKYRGSYNIGVDTIYIMDFFGLIKIKYKAIETIKLLVYPNIEKISRFSIKPIITEDTLTLDRKLFHDKTNLFQIKEYEKGDSLNQIHWKLSAKLGEFMSKQYSSSLRKKTIIFLDNKKLHYGAETNLIIEDLLVEAIVSITYYHLFSQIPIQLYTYDKEISVLNGDSLDDWQIIYEKLALLQFYENCELDTMIHRYINESVAKQKGSNIIVAINNITDNVLNSVLMLKSRGYEVSIILAINDEQFIEIKQIINRIEEEKIKIYILRPDHTLKSVIEGDYNVS